ncbi:hypothetical protein GALMADRAFT_584049 [Galerina marginata CBS 339.88]|uniref:Fungal-type protein kinase domain-containing protein n=1 Tax=Galerina marginata (strain CBS 339.88) TaxID=685588 RepID=A0A067SU31_GALM3|nr:hypothetical protein GALMADRAFT_584049 [Galerina marginata CBS 339.88]
MGTDTSDRLGAIQWIDYHTATSMATNRYVVPTRPDCILSLPSLKGVDANVNSAIWWLQIIAAVEIKRCDDDSWVKVVQQLIGYLRRVLCEQTDRRFVFGLTVGLDKVTVWLHDRSGVLGTATSIDIHAQPQKFIQIIAAFAVLPAAKLGFDPSMKLYVSPNCVKPSYLHETADVVKLREKPQDTQWVIELNDGKQFLTVFALSLASAQEMHGLGTIAWVVVPYGHSMNGEEQPDQGQEPTQRQVFVMKQSWRRVDSESEGNLYNAARGTNSTAPEFVGRILLCEDVLYGSDRDDTSTLIRQNLGIDSPTFTVAGTKRSRSEAYIHIDTTEQKEISFIWLRERASEAIARVRTRVLMSTYGWPIDNFASMKELVRGITDAIKGHKHLYENGVLHRDISPGNIIIGWHPGHEITDADSRGCLIDLDHAKEGQKQVVDVILPSAKEVINSDYGDNSDGGNSPEILHQTMVLFVGRNVRNSALRREIKDAELFHPEHLPATIYEQARLIMSQGAASAYVKAALLHALKFRHLVPGNTCSEDVLGWHQVRPCYCLFQREF